MMSYWLPEAPI